MDELISIIMPIYNAEKYLKNAIDSIISQTYKNIELILVNDGSKDSSYKLCKEYEKKDKRIKVYDKEHEGIARTRNYAISKANGKYITFCDADDCCDKRIIEFLYNGLLETKSDISAIGYKEINDISEIGNPNYSDKYIIFSKKEAIINTFNDKLFGNFLWNKLFKKELFDDISFDNDSRIEDLSIMYLLFEKANQVVFNDSKLYYYIQRKTSELHKKSISIFTAKFHEYGKKYFYIKEKYPDITENYVEFAKIIIECFPFIMFNKQDRTIAREEMSKIYNIVEKSLSKKDLVKTKLYRLK